MSLIGRAEIRGRPTCTNQMDNPGRVFVNPFKIKAYMMKYQNLIQEIEIIENHDHEGTQHIEQ